VAVCPACLAALVASAATSVSTLWAFKRVVVEAISMRKTSTEARHERAPVTDRRIVARSV